MIAAAVVSLGVGLGFFFSKRTPENPAPPAPVNTADAKPAEGAVVYANSLPGGSASGGGGAPVNFSGGPGPGGTGDFSQGRPGKMAPGSFR